MRNIITNMQYMHYTDEDYLIMLDKVKEILNRFAKYSIVSSDKEETPPLPSPDERRKQAKEDQKERLEKLEVTEPVKTILQLMQDDPDRFIVIIKPEHNGSCCVIKDNVNEFEIKICKFKSFYLDEYSGTGNNKWVNELEAKLLFEKGDELDHRVRKIVYQQEQERQMKCKQEAITLYAKEG